MEPRNERLWKIARLRAKFKNSVVTYLIVNTMLVGIWYFTSGARNFFWPLFPLVFWGIGLAFNYYHAYWDNGDLVQKEYEKTAPRRTPVGGTLLPATRQRGL